MLVTTKGLFSLLFLLGSFVFFDITLASSVAPSVVDIQVDQGREVTEEFVLFHNESSAQEYSVDLVTVNLGGGESEITFSPLTSSIADWLSVDQSYLIVEPGEVKKILLTIAIPSSVKSQVHVVGLKIVQLNADGVAVNVQTGHISLAFLTVGDDFADGAELLDFSTPKTTYSALPVTFRTTLRNQEERILQPAGSVTVRSMFGNIVTSYNVNEEGRRIPSGQERTYSVTWGSDVEDGGFFSLLKNETRQFAFGFFNVELNIVAYEGGGNITDTTRVFIFPWRFALVIIAVFALFYGAMRAVRKK